jgi:DNA-directed RNA polymerase specialized sigma24 family protein
MSLAIDHPATGFRVVRRWELTREALDGLLARLDTDPTAAGEKYERLRRALLKFFSWHQIPEADSSVDETLDRIARRLDAGHHIDDVPVFAYGVARMVRLERQRKSAAIQTTGEELLLAQAAPPQCDCEDIEARDACLQRCLAELSPKDRDLIVTYYVGTGRERIEGRAQLAAALGLSDNALRHRAQRLRDRLRARAAQYLEQTADDAPIRRFRYSQESQESGRAAM